ncbi:GNAT family N-acetyltransferase [Mucilaginibacter sp. AW1-7]|uniref:bifunctional helix-turn-helix transcriptional regulator/GNAT family N-acetyltransferase n=1 Tax=Mucilaginibacter sp. AW1-7 TaxID=3349874 RepID=UPI003F736438
MENSFFNSVGKAGIGSRLRMLQEKITDDAANIYRMFGIDMQPKWFPVFYTLSQGSFTITEIAQHIGHSHPSVSKIVSEMVKKGLVTEGKDANDGRRNVLSLSDKGKQVNEKLQYQLVDVKNAVEGILDNTRHNLWEAIGEWEFMLEQKSLLKRVQDEKKLREGRDVTIVPFEEQYSKAFRELNVEWISTYFKMEEKDYQSLDHPQEYILNKGGEILVALYKGEPVGVCALLKMDDPEYDYELAKMAVSPKAHGKGIGWLLGKAIAERAKARGGNTLYLESNTMLKQAISLYQKLGFKKVIGRFTPYERCNIQMELQLNN